MTNSFDVPILLIIYKRPQTTKLVLDALRKVKPVNIYVVSDGPSYGDIEEKRLNDMCKKLINDIDWKCNLYKNYADVNMGLQNRISSGISWFLNKAKEGIILEDDCIPSKSFFPFCRELLNKYRNNNEIMTISGNNFQNGKKRGHSSYYFSIYPHIWGWATWKRAWNFYDGKMKSWPEVKRKHLFTQLLKGRSKELYWEYIFDRAYSGVVNSWAYRWTYSCWIRNGLTVIPQTNLVRNIGFDKFATHTKKGSSAMRPKIKNMKFPLKHPLTITCNKNADNFTFWRVFATPIIISSIFLHRMIYNLLKLLKNENLISIRKAKNI